MFCQRVEQFWVGRWIGGTHVIYRVDDPGAKQITPDAVRHAAGETAVLGIEQPVDQWLAEIDDRRRVDRIGEQRRGGNNLAGTWVTNFTGRLEADYRVEPEFSKGVARFAL